MSSEFDDIHEALGALDVIDQALGVLMIRYDVSEAVAFHLLVQESSTFEESLDEAAVAILETPHRR